jgi:hypothetical protein
MRLRANRWIYLALLEKFQIAEKKRANAYENLIETLKAIESLTISDSNKNHKQK